MYPSGRIIHNHAWNVADNCSVRFQPSVWLVIQYFLVLFGQQFCRHFWWPWRDARDIFCICEVRSKIIVQAKICFQIDISPSTLFYYMGWACTIYRHNSFAVLYARWCKLVRNCATPSHIQSTLSLKVKKCATPSLIQSTLFLKVTVKTRFHVCLWGSSHEVTSLKTFSLSNRRSPMAGDSVPGSQHPEGQWNCR